MIKDYRVYIEDIAEAIRKIEKFTENLDYESFVNTPIIIDAVIRNFEVLGEAAVKIPPEIRSKYKQVPWVEMAGMRNKLIHEYSRVNNQILWKTIISDLPLLKIAMSNIIDQDK